MPFSKFDVDPDIESMRTAFRLVCDALQLDCRADDPMTEIVVMKVVELAKAGERDPELEALDVADLALPAEARPRRPP